jgi:hypothetical protein
MASALQINKKKQAVKHAVADVVSQASPTAVFHTAFFSAVSDPCLQVADYVTWAIQRKFESNDPRPYEVIAHQVETCFEPFAVGTRTYY